MSARLLKPVPERAAETGSLAGAAVAQVDARFLQDLVGYNARRAALVMMALFGEGVAPLGLKPVEFSVLSLIHANAGITSRQLCDVLAILPPNLVGIINPLQQRGLINRRPHHNDGRALGLHLTEQGQSLIAVAEQTVSAQEAASLSRLSAAERQTLIRLLQKIYLNEQTEAPPPATDPAPDAH